MDEQLLNAQLTLDRLHRSGLHGVLCALLLPSERSFDDNKRLFLEVCDHFQRLAVQQEELQAACPSPTKRRRLPPSSGGAAAVQADHLHMPSGAACRPSDFLQAARAAAHGANGSPPQPRPLDFAEYLMSTSLVEPSSFILNSILGNPLPPPPPPPARQPSRASCNRPGTAAAAAGSSKESTGPSLLGLPDELILKILSYFNKEELGRASLVCFRLRELANDSALWKGLDLSSIHSSGRVLEILQHPRCAFVQELILGELALNRMFCSSLAVLTPNVVSLDLSSCTEDPPPATTGSVFDIYRPLPATLRRITLPFLSHLTSTDFPHFCKRFNRVDALKVYNAPKIQSGWTGVAMLTGLTTLKLESSMDAAYAALLHALHALPNLRKLVLANCGAQDAWLDVLVRHSPGLRSLTLQQCDGITDVGVATLAGLRHLALVRLVDLERITDASVSSLSSIPSLRHVELHMIPGLSDAACIALAQLPSLTYLDLSECADIKDVGVAFLSGLESLTYLDVSGNGELTDASLETIFSLHTLRFLNLYFCGAITDAGVCLGADKLPHLSSLRLGECRSITSRGLRALCSPPRPALRHLSLAATAVDDAFTVDLPRLAPNLHDLDLSECEGITDVTLNSISELRHIVQLDISGCNNVSEAGLSELSSACQALRTLVVFPTASITNVDIFSQLNTNLKVMLSKKV